MYKISNMALLISALLPASLLAQTLEGKITQEDGKAIAGASVRIDGTHLATTTNRDGYFIFTDLKPGLKELHVASSGFAHLHQDISVKGEAAELITLTLLPSPIEVIDVIATPIHMSVMESAAPVSVLAGETLRRQQASTLGDSLEKITGVH